MTIKVLGSDCANGKRLEALVRQAVEPLGAEAEIIKVTEYPDVVAYSLMSTPGL